jgi:hypothetical protein
VFIVLKDPSANAFWLDGGTMWFRAEDPHGPWAKTDAPPAEALAIAKSDREQAGVSGKEKDAAKTDEPKDDRVPKILVATSPTELIVSDGEPKWSPLVEGELETLATSDNDVFKTPSDEATWVVLSGRFYRAASLGGPWTYVGPDDVPAAFRRIPSDSPKAEVLAFVPGTRTSHEALEDASTPRTTAVRRKDAHVDVTYDGEPRFEPIPGTRVATAVNTPEDVLEIRGRYYAVDQGVWFTSAAPRGPWAVADAIPEEEIDAIPPESPAYHTRFVTVYDATPDVVYTAYWPGYLGSYPYYGTVVYGTGWAYRPWWGAYYYPRPWTWGFHALYRPWFGWGWGFAWRPAWAGFRWGLGYGWGARWCGPGGFYRPAFVHVTRNVNITRNVTRNVYNSTANRTRTAATSRAAANAAPRSAAPRGAAPGARHPAGAKPQGAKPQAQGAKPHAGGGAKPHAAGGKGHAGKKR